mgnify:CR=1 FL=1
MADIKSTTGVTQAVAVSALRAQQARMRIIAENLANADSTSKTAGGDPYRRQAPVFKPSKVAGAQGVRMTKVEPDQSPFRQEYEPGNPSADAKGYVKLPNVDSLVEIMDMREAQRSYEADLSVMESTKQMLAKTVDLLK